MAILLNETSGEKLHLRSLHVFGRNPSKSDTQLENSDASQLHASIRWDGRIWEIIDHSRNGTLIDSKPLASNTKHALAIGQTIRFGAGSTANWVVKDLDPPCPILVSQQPHLADIHLHSFHPLPDEELPLAAVYLANHGQWGWENSSGWSPLREGEVIHVGEASWRFIGSPEIESTAELAISCTHTMELAQFNFIVSQNEEHISLQISDSKGSVDLGERIHHYSLLILARHRRDDASRGLSRDSQGWIETEQLSSILGLDPSYLNIQIFRARNQISRALPLKNLANSVVERRRGEMRFGSFPFQIIRGGNIEGVFNPNHTP